MEFGVGEGKSLALAFHAARRRKMLNPRIRLGTEAKKPAMKFYAFDSFQSYPKLKEIDKGMCFREGLYGFSQEEIKHILKKRYKLNDLSKITFIAGWYKDLKKVETLKKVAILYIDCDIYSSARDALEFITDYIQDGTVVVLCAYFAYKASPHKGQRKAFEDWLKKNSFKVTQFYKINNAFGNSFIIHKSEKSGEI